MQNKLPPLLIPALIIIALGFAVYGNSLSGKFLYDDLALVKNNLHIRDFSYLTNIFKEDVGKGALEEYKFFRPIQTASYMVDHLLWGLDPFGYHLTNIILHILAALCVLWFIYILFGDALVAGLTAVLFLVQPVQTEAVSYISGRSDPLSVIFLMLAFISYVKHIRSRSVVILACALLSYAVAILSRESALILPVIILLYHYSFKEPVRAVPFFSMAAVPVIYLIYRTTSMPALLPHLTSGTTLGQRIPGALVAFFEYLRLLVAPLGLHMEYGAKLFGFNDLRVAAGLLLIAVIISYLVISKKRSIAVFFGLAWFIVTLLPSLNLYPINAFMAEHWLYLPSIGFFLALAYCAVYLYRSGKFAVAVVPAVVALVIVWSYLTIRQNEYWHDPVSFYKRTLVYAPDSFKSYNNLGKLSAEAKRYEEAIRYFKKAMEIRTDYAVGYGNAGLAYKDLGDYEEALIFLDKAIELKPDYMDAYVCRSSVYSKLGRHGEAIASLEKAIELKPDAAGPYNDIGVIYFEDLKNAEGSIRFFKKAIEINPYYADAFRNLSIAYKKLGKTKEAEAAMQKALKLKAVAGK